MHRARAVTALRLLVACVFPMLASQASAQQQGGQPDVVTLSVAVDAPAGGAGRILGRLHVSEDVRATWDRVVACAGEVRDTTKTLDEIVFLLRAPGPIGPSGKPTKGEWIAPDTILITQGWEHSSWVVAHEMLHHALNGPPIAKYGTDHPFVPFAPCGLYYDPTGDGQLDAELARSMVGGPSFAYPVLGYAVYIQGTLLAGHGWWRA